MSSAREAAMNAISQQITLQPLIAHPPEPDTIILPSGTGERTTSQYPTERQGTVVQAEPPTQIQNPYTLAPLVPGSAGLAPPPPPNKSGGKGQQKPQDERTAAEKLRLQALRTQLQAARVGQSIANFFKTQNRSVGSIPTPGGIWVPFWILVGLFLILIPVNGHTRLNWLWLALIGSAAVDATITGSNNVGTVTQDTTTLTTPTLSIPTSPPPTFSPVPIPTGTPIPLVSNYLSGINIEGNN